MFTVLYLTKVKFYLQLNVKPHIFSEPWQRFHHQHDKKFLPNLNGLDRQQFNSVQCFIMTMFQLLSRLIILYCWKLSPFWCMKTIFLWKKCFFFFGADLSLALNEPKKKWWNRHNLRKENWRLIWTSQMKRKQNRNRMDFMNIFAKLSAGYSRVHKLMINWRSDQKSKASEYRMWKRIAWMNVHDLLPPFVRRDLSIFFSQFSNDDYNAKSP